MAGLLDIFGTSGTGALSLLGGGDIEQARNDAQAQALYALAGRLFQGGSTGQSIAEGLQMGQQAYKQAMQGELSDRLTQFQLQEFKRKREEELASKLRAEQARKALMGAYVQPQAGTPELPPTTYGYEDVAVPGTYGVEGRAATPARYDLSKVAPALMSGAYGQEGLSLLTQMLQMEKLGRPEFHALPEGSTGVVYDPSSQGFKKVAEGAPKDVKTTDYSNWVLAGKPGTFQEWIANKDQTSDYKNWALAGKPGTFQNWLKESKKPLVVMTEGQKGFENTSALKKQFGGEPIYKEYADIALAHPQVLSSIKQDTPIGDTAAATKIMKLLDPGSVVRETELGMAMAATGKMDRLKNYMELSISGKKLTDKQRVDFENLANQLYNAAAQAYNEKRNEYVNLGKGFGLNTDLALGKPAKVFSLETPLPIDLSSRARQELERRKRGQ